VSREPIPTWFFALVVVRKGNRFLLVQERKHGQQWYLPAGRVEPAETMAEGALRETLEEAGIVVVLEGVVRVEHTPSFDGTARVRVIYLARPADESPLKSTPDAHSLQARWFTLEELSSVELRGDEVRELFDHVARGGTVAPLEVLGRE